MITIGDDILDSRDIEERIDDLEAEAEDEPLDAVAAAELAALITLRDEAQDYTSEWHDGATLILDSYFEAYAEQLAEDIGAIDRNATWPLTYIDWERAADALRQDYTEFDVDVDGTTYTYLVQSA